MWKHLFLPHQQTHKKAHLLSWEALLIYILIFILLQVSFSFLAQVKPGVLGVSSNIDQHQLIELTNKKRAENNLPPLKENLFLDQAAQAKAANMFAENYWAHYAPSGKDPWGFINGSGYKFTYAGENLARNFYSSDDVVNAWMASPSHRENIVNNKYQEIGIAVVYGVLKGEKTTLVVQMFGTPQEYIAYNPTTNIESQKKAEVALPSVKPAPIFTPAPALVAGVRENQQLVTIDPFKTTKTLGVGLLLLIAFLIMLDLYTLRRRAIFRVTSKHLPHLALIGLSTFALLNLSSGSIL